MKRIVSTFLIMVLVFSLCSCSSKSFVSNIDNVSKDTNSIEKGFSLVEEKEIDYSDFKGLLSEVSYGVSDYCTYSVYDINNDGIREMIIKVGTCESDYKYHFYGLSEDFYSIEIGEFPGSSSMLYADEEKAGIICVSGHQGYQTVTHIGLKDNQIVTTTILEGEIGDGNYFSNASPLSECYTKDDSLLSKDAKLVGVELVFDPESIEPVNESNFETIPVSMNIIDMEFDLVCKKATATVMEVHTDNIRNFHINLKENQKLYCMFGDVYEYFIVENNLVVGYMMSNGSVSQDRSMKQYLPSDDFYSIEPQIAFANSYGYCCWETTNCYVILGVAGINESSDRSNYYNWPANYYYLIKDLSQFAYTDQYKEN